MRQVQLYKDGEQVELFNDESISLTQTIQNVKDIGKVFANFTQSFNLPATKANNKIFSHYYNYDIDNGFDARKKVGARIELNYLPFQTGKIKLDGVQLKDNKAYSYKVTFYGDIVDLKDILGDDKLSGLSWLANFTRTYQAVTIRSDLAATGVSFTVGGVTYTNAWVMPLITNSNRLFYDSGVTPPDYFNADGTINPLGSNLYYDGNPHGVYFQELKYAIRVWLIIKAIEESYGITFSSGSFLKDTSNPQFYNLYMWMHRESGYAFKPGAQASILYNQFTTDLSSMSNVIMLNDKAVIYGLTGGDTVAFTLTITCSGGNAYTVKVYKDGDLVFQDGDNSGGDVVIFGNLTNSSVGYQIYIEGPVNAGVNYTAEWALTKGAENHDYLGGNQAITVAQRFVAQEQMPNQKVIDFLTGLFKMFNLTARKNAAGEIVIETLNDFYASGVERDISKYVDASDSNVDVALPYKDLKFEFKGRGSKVTKLYEEQEGIGWGTTEYKIDNDLFGETYTIEAPFEHMQFEKIDGLDVQHGASINDSDKPYVGEPLIFYPYLITGGDAISFLNVPPTVTSITSYTVPLNSVGIDSATDDDTCHFSAEINEYTNGVFNGSLFANYYQTYIEDTFNPKRRITKVKAKLPVSFLTNYSLADILVINNRQYRINSITTNLNTGESDLELLNII